VQPPIGSANGLSIVDTVLKVGGALLRDPAMFERAVQALGQIAADSRVLIVPGGGPFADVVRDLDRKYALGDDETHWMAVLAMDQHAHLLVSKIPRASLVESAVEVESGLEAGSLPILAPYRWLLATDPLPHSWEVTSDSIAAWVAEACGASDLILLKAVDGPASELTDSYFSHYLSNPNRPFRIQVSTVHTYVVPADRTSHVPPSSPLGDYPVVHDFHCV
jgi:aspartokinase-like uncharacterized kinase